MKKLLAALILFTLALSVQAASTEPGGVVDQNTQARGAVGTISATITTGGVSQVALTANQFRRYVMILNPVGATETLYISSGSTVASATTISLAPGQSIVFETLFMTTDAWNVFAATTGHAYVVLAG